MVGRILGIALALALTGCSASPVSVPIATRSPAGESASPYTDRDLIQGFNATVFGAEAGAADRREATERVKKFVGPISYSVYDLATKKRADEVHGFIRALDTSVQRLDFKRQADGHTAQMVIFVVDRGNYADTIRDTLPRSADTTFLEENDCSAVTSGDSDYRLDRAFVFIVADEGDQAFQHCLHEEIMQVLGPVNDSRSLSHSIFNDYSSVNDYSAFDWFILDMLYNPRIKPGMTAREVAPLLPPALADSRARYGAVSRSIELAVH
jgi:Protein of unknown function (DUF2927)